MAKKMHLKTGEAAALLGVTQQTVTNWINNHHLKALRTPSNRFLIEGAEVERIRKSMAQEVGIKND